MKSPRKPPTTAEIFQSSKSQARLVDLLEQRSRIRDDRYRHWDILRHLQPPEGLTPEEWWFLLKFGRDIGIKKIPLCDLIGRRFRYNIPDLVAQQLHVIDLGAGGTIGVPDSVTNPQTRNQYLVRSLVREAITSSQLEGAVTTREVAKDMLRTGRSPRNRSEQMILNNYLTMQQIREWKDRELDPDLVFEIHRHVTHETLEKPDAAGRFRRADEPVTVQDTITGEVFHKPPPADQLPERLNAMCQFANGRSPDSFVHPAIRAILLHFWLAYDHPFVDGNGRTARALFYWSMLRQGYWLFEFISISEILLRAPAKYALAFLHTETDENDLTYFIIHQTEVIGRALKMLHDYIAAKEKETAAVTALLRSGVDFNHRQQALIGHALRNPGRQYTVDAHQNSHHVAYETARKDLLDLRDRGLLDMRKVGKAYTFRATADLAERLRSLRGNGL